MAQAQQMTPVTMLSGFLGAGKTTLLRHLLENSKERIACIVNDVASINIDAKLVRNDRNRSRAEGQGVNTTADLADTIELANGCACCNLQDELFASFEQILALADKNGQPYSRIVLENSGVAEPQNIRDKFAEAAMQGHPVCDRVTLDTLVTLVDAGTFIQDYSSRAPLAARPELGEGGTLRPVVDLLVEQVECADFVILNKTDLLPKDGSGSSDEALGQLVAIVSSLNPLATVIPAQQGQVDLERVFGSSAHRIMSSLNVEGQHRGAVAAAKAAAAAEGQKRPSDDAEGDAGHKHHKHSHDHHHHHQEHKGSGGHAHHDHGSEGCAVCRDGTAEAGHEHSHDGHEHSHDGHEHSHDGHEHSHDGHAHHAHHHGHSSKHAETRAAERFGIRSFVYNRRRPFHPQRLKDMVLRWLPVTDNRAIDGAAPELGDSPIKSVLRSKGFVWLSSSHTTAYYWSHAGQHFEIRDEGDWWAAVPDDEWPTADVQRQTILDDFDGRWGDRRQEIVFIGVRMDQAKICEQLDGALLTDEEMGKYVERWGSLPDPEHPRPTAAATAPTEPAAANA